MTTDLEDAIAAFRDLAQAKARLTLDCEGIAIREEQLARELGDVTARCADAKNRLIALASGMMCEACHKFPASTTRSEYGRAMRYLCDSCATAQAATP
jgi:hypothetical protein